MSKVSAAVINRLPKYYRYLDELIKKGIERISSQELSHMTGFTASQIRQDLNNFGGFGQQGYGYNCIELRKHIGRILGMPNRHKAVVVGMGHLGQAIGSYKGFQEIGIDVVAFFDRNKSKIGTKLRGIEIRSIDDMGKYIRDEKIDIAVLTVSKEGAQPITDMLVEAGIKGIWNFAPIDLNVPDDIKVENVRLNDSILVLSYHLANEAN